MSNEARTISNVTVKWTAAGTKSDVTGGANGFSIAGVIWPASGFTGTKITFESSADGINFAPLYYSPGDGTSAAVSVPKAASPSTVSVDAGKTIPIQYLKAVSDASEAANTTIKLVCVALQ